MQGEICVRYRGIFCVRKCVPRGGGGGSGRQGVALGLVGAGGRCYLGPSDG